MNALILNSLEFANELISIRLGFFCCDNPANSYIRGSKGHAGRGSCIKCTQEGMSLNNRWVFQHIKYVNRTDQDFRDRIDPHHHVKDSILENLESIDMVN